MPEQPSEAKWKSFLAIAERVEEVLRSASRNEELSVAPIYGFVLSQYWRSVRLYRASLILVRNGAPEEALIVGRSLFEDSLRLTELADDPANYESLILGWLNRSIQEQRGLVHDAARLGIENEPEIMFSKLDEQQRQVDRYVQRNDIGRLRNFTRTRDIAPRYRRLDDVWTYLISHEMVHGSDLALKFSRKKREPGNISLFLINEDPQLLIGVIAFCATSALHAGRAAWKIFEWSEPPEFDTLLRMVHEYDDVTE